MRARKYLISTIGLIIFLFTCLNSLQKNNAAPFHTEDERKHLTEKLLSPIDSDEYFLGSIACKGCHGYDTLQIANVDEDGVDINLYDDWQTTMMANSSKDPLWRAKVSHEILVNPAHAAELQTQCTSCHAPMGHFTAIYKGASYYSMDDLQNDTLGLDGVACGGCHEIGSENAGLSFSGNIPYDTSKKEFGPFENPVIGPMQLYVGLIPTYSTHVSKGSFCSSCHTLISHSVDLSGNYTGNTFIEQATYHEWLNSALAADNITCQKCHMPQVTDSVIIANGLQSLAPRSPFNLHQFAGGNWFMVNLIKENKEALNISSPGKNFDSTLKATYRMLTEKSVSINLSLTGIDQDTASFILKIINKAGHKFPSGYPSRRAVVQLVLTTANGDSIFQSGVFDSDYEVKNNDPEFEPHYDVITDPSQVQIYEMVIGDVTGNVTTIIERADETLKDNRIPPEGFTTTFYSYDTTQIIGVADDADFNVDGTTEGTGADAIHFNIPLNGTTGVINAYAKVFYQSVPPRWVNEMFNYSSAAIDSFKKMYLNADRSPIVVASDSLENIILPTSAELTGSEHGLRVLNTITSNEVTIENPNRIAIKYVRVWNSTGEHLLEEILNSRSSGISIHIPGNAGICYMEITTGYGTYFFKVLKMSIR